MKTLFLFCIISAGTAIQAQNNFKYLDINNVKAGCQQLGHDALQSDGIILRI